MKATISRRTLVALSLAILAFLSLACFSACNETEADTTSDIIANESTAPEIIDGKYTSYNEDGTVNYEEFYYDSGAVSKRIEYYYEPNSLTERTETDFDESGKMTTKKSFMYEYLAIRTYDSNENCLEILLCYSENNATIGKTVMEYDSNHNMINEILFDANGDTIIECSFSCNEYGALTGERRYEKNIHNSPEHNTVNEYLYEIVYEPEDMQKRHEHEFAYDLNEGYWTIRNDIILVSDSDGYLFEEKDYKRIVSATYYNNSAISSTINREYGENGDYMIHEINYKADSSIQNEMYYDKDGNKKQFIRYDENGEKYITNYD